MNTLNLPGTCSKLSPITAGAVSRPRVPNDAGAPGFTLHERIRELLVKHVSLVVSGGRANGAPGRLDVAQDARDGVADMSHSTSPRRSL